MKLEVDCCYNIEVAENEYIMGTFIGYTKYKVPVFLSHDPFCGSTVEDLRTIGATVVTNTIQYYYWSKKDILPTTTRFFSIDESRVSGLFDYMFDGLQLTLIELANEIKDTE